MTSLNNSKIQDKKDNINFSIEFKKSSSLITSRIRICSQSLSGIDKRKYLSAFFICLLGLSSWIDVNAIWSLASIISSNLVEKAKSLSIITIIIQISNISTIIYSISRHKMPYFLTKYKHIFIIVIILTDIICLLLLSFFWDWNVSIAGKKVSLPIYTLFFFMAFVDCLSTVIYIPYVSNYSSSYISAFYFGQTLSNLIPSSLKLLQGQKTIASTNRLDGDLISTQNYILIICGIVSICLISFIVLHWKYFNEQTNLNLEPDCNNYTTRIPKTLMGTYAVITIYTAIFNGILPQLLYYATSKYSPKTMDYANNLSSIFGSIMAIIMPYTKLTSATIATYLLALYICLTSYIAAVATVGPFFNESTGMIIIIIAFISCSMIWSISRHLLINKCFTIGENALFWMGAAMQFGSFIGTFSMYLPVFVFNVFKQ